METYITNAFSLNMLAPLSEGDSIELRVEAVDPQNWLYEGSRKFRFPFSAVGHPDTAAMFSKELGRSIECDRVTLQLYQEDEALVGQYVGPRLPEGTRTLPSDARIVWRAVTVLSGPTRPKRVVIPGATDRLARD